MTSAAGCGPAITSTRLNSPRRSGRAIARPPSMREKVEPHRPTSATGTTGTGWRSRIFMILP